MEKKQIKLSTLDDMVVFALRSNDYVDLWYNGKEVESITVTDGGPGKHYAKYRINTTKGQYRTDDPIIEFLR